LGPPGSAVCRWAHRVPLCAVGLIRSAAGLGSSESAVGSGGPTTGPTV